MTMSEGLTRHWQNDRKRKKRRHGFEVQEELGAAAHPGGEQTRGSGCSQRPAQKGDSVGDYFRQSAKTTEKGSISLKREWWGEIEGQARATGHRAMLVIGFDGSSNRPRTDLACFDLSVAERMTGAVAALLDGDVEKARELASLAVRGS